MQEKLKRLTRLIGSDPGFYVLALHSFVEHYIRDVSRESEAETFREVVQDFYHSLIERTDSDPETAQDALRELTRQHKFTNSVRHSFHDLEPHEAVAATHLFIAFCNMIGAGDLPEVRTLADSLHLWEAQPEPSMSAPALTSLQSELRRLQSQNHALLSQLSDYDEAEHKLATLQNQIERYSLELDAAKLRTRSKDERVDELRRERAELKSEKKRLLERMEGFEALERYIESLGRFSVYTRTRLDYERTLMRLTPEQEEASSQIHGDADVLVRGGPGTGKSLVLIEAVRRALEVGELDFGREKASGAEHRAVLLTFTRTLAKFEHYVAKILRLDHVREIVRTVDAFVLERLRRIDSEYGFSFKAVDEAVSELNTTDFMTDDELVTEIESYLFANFVSRDEYVDQMVARVGMRRRLGKSQRETVWTIRDEIAERMDRTKLFSRNYARLKILEFLNDADPEQSSSLRDVRTIYLDETQDLTSGDLLTLKSLITGNLVMASDTQQSIYGVSSPFARAGIQIAGRTRVLRTNFRNTRQISAAAARFARTDEDHFAFRDGPPPELHRVPDAELLPPLLAAKLHLYLKHLEYEPENICLLAPHNSEVEHLKAVLDEAGVSAQVTSDREFSFDERGSVRISTLHSSKGLDFPVVMLYLPYIQRRERFDPETTERLTRNLIYVGITRAMENLSVFVAPGDDPVLVDLCAAIEPGD